MIKFWRHKTARHGSPLWLIIFSDLSTNLMLFFLMLFAMTRMSVIEREKLLEGLEFAVNKDVTVQERVVQKRREKEAIRMLKDTIIHGKLKEYATIDVNETNIKLTLELPVFFDTGSAKINDVATDALDSLTRPLQNFPHDIIIEGHTDNVPITGGRYPSNWELSVARAVSVINFFIQRGLDPKKLVAGGYGEYHPVASNDSPETRVRNRRIEITILRHPKA